MKLIIYCNSAYEFYQSYRACDPEGDVFTSTDINDAFVFYSKKDAEDFSAEHLVDGYVLEIA